MLAMLQMGEIPLTSFQLLTIGGVLLVCAALLLLIRRKTKVEVDSSIVTEELMAYLRRIADALEAQRPPSTEQITGEVLKKLQEIANAKPGNKVREMTLVDR
jgi:hypothetical protein